MNRLLIAYLVLAALGELFPWLALFYLSWHWDKQHRARLKKNEG